MITILKVSGYKNPWLILSGTIVLEDNNQNKIAKVT
jgi:hypothetical protein